MSSTKTDSPRIILGDPVPWFSLPVVTGGSFDLQASGGRWVALSFVGPLSDPRAMAEVSELAQLSTSFDEDHLVIGCVFTGAAENVESLAAMTSGSLSFLADQDGAISRMFGAGEMPRTVIIDPMLRAIADIAWDNPQGHANMVRTVVQGLPPVDDSAGVPMFAPALLVPRVFSFGICDFLIQFYETQGAVDSGFQFDVDGKTVTLSDWRLKRRSDVPVGVPEVRELIRDHIVRRLVGPIERYFQFKVTRMDRYIVACYDSAVAAHFHRHRDNINAGAQHRRFALSINLNNDFDGGDLMFPEFGRKTYRPSEGGALVFSCGALHQVTPVTRGKRYAFLAFMYGEEDVTLREANNAKLHAGELQYTAGRDRLFPEKAKPEIIPSVA
ncbi:2OG-Fe(II) oxygenase [Bradyrhizobium sp.]|uniref:2OG-Fe(II) oxygenase n=1 Tax=Bradyrhizobium sp. TaxID=376 RepID=UPI002D6CB8C5|nr:2OG-Fe(II) oxygenase [Bradyrhizobium sp.]HZR74622.1 2OG-Fe(II) oxygenase [Bradyrhizobium sp.]